jgi:hypothetical protein
LVQVQIDGAESPLEVDTDSGYIGPVVEIGWRSKGTIAR